MLEELYQTFLTGPTRSAGPTRSTARVSLADSYQVHDHGSISPSNHPDSSHGSECLCLPPRFSERLNSSSKQASVSAAIFLLDSCFWGDPTHTLTVLRKICFFFEFVFQRRCRAPHDRKSPPQKKASNFMHVCFCAAL